MSQQYQNNLSNIPSNVPSNVPSNDPPYYQNNQEMMCESYPDTDTPLILFIIYCFFVLCIIIFIRTYRLSPPSGLSIGSYSFMSMLSCFIIILFGLISVYAEWTVMLIFTLGITFFMISILNPSLFIYQRTSTM